MSWSHWALSWKMELHRYCQERYCFSHAQLLWRYWRFLYPYKSLTVTAVVIVLPVLMQTAKQLSRSNERACVDTWTSVPHNMYEIFLDCCAWQNAVLHSQPSITKSISKRQCCEDHASYKPMSHVYCREVCRCILFNTARVLICKHYGCSALAIIKINQSFLGWLRSSTLMKTHFLTQLNFSFVWFISY